MRKRDMKYIFETNNLSYTYPGNIPSLREINLAIAPGELVGLLGANGSGKSTLLKIMDGLIFPSSGEILAFGKQAIRTACRQPAIKLRLIGRELETVNDPFYPGRVIGAPTCAGVQQSARDIRKKHLARVLVFDFLETAKCAPITKRLPLFRRHL